MGKTPLPNECPVYDANQCDSNGGALEMRSTPSLPSLLGPFCYGVVAPETVLSMDQIELFDI